MKNQLLLLSLLLTFNLLSAQHQCGVRHGDDTAIKARMMRNRSTINAPEFRNTVYVPVTIHLIGSSGGGGAHKPEEAIKMLCKLNEDFADQNVFFFLNGNVRFLYDDYLHSDSYDWGVMNAMGNAKVPNTLNIFVNSNVSQPVAGYYSPGEDFVWMGTPYANGSSTTITHEIGHFFTLPHTFYGWEGVNAPSLYSQLPAPADINGYPVENVVRDNCLLAGDGFCDTEADYISFRYNCPFVTLVQDPSGTVITPDPSYFMSYSSDNCMSRFSQEQKDAIRADITQRGWLNTPAPANLSTIVSDSISAIMPMNAALVTPVNNVRFEWDTRGATAATKWVFNLERTVLGMPVESVLYTIVNGQNFINVSASEFLSNRDYRWSVVPYSSAYTCAGKSADFTFRTTVVSGLENATADKLKTEVFPNPASNSVQLRISSDKYSKSRLRILAADGRSVLDNNSFEIEAGQNTYQIDISSFAPGFYTLQVLSESGVVTEKLVVESK
jgi:hypothetical protein